MNSVSSERLNGYLQSPFSMSKSKDSVFLENSCTERGLSLIMKN